MDAIKMALSEPNRFSAAMTSFGQRLSAQFSSNKAYRRAKELEWLESMRQYKGLYDPDVKIEENASKVYPKITRSKLNIVLSRLHDMLFPETDKNWEIEPTPEPKIAKETIVEIAKGLFTQDPETGENKPPSLDELRIAIKAFAKHTCELMSSEIDDQLIEMDYKEETKKVLRSGLLYGTGIMKGPMIKKRTKRKWEPLPSGDYEEKIDNEDLPDLQFVRLWDWYPDMAVTEPEDMEGSFERHGLNKHDLRKLAKKEGYYSDVIEKYMKDNPEGNYTPEFFEVELQTIEMEAGSGQSTTGSTTTTRPETSIRQIGRRYELAEFWGYVDGSDMEACGIQVPDVSLEYGCNAWLLGNKVIACFLFENALDQYKIFYYEKDETSIFGEGLARVMRHSQIAVASAARMVLDNGSCVAGPQVEVNYDLLVPGTDYSSFYSRKIWYRKGRGIDAQYRAIQAINFDSHIEELIKIGDWFLNFADMETTLPTWMIGQMVNNETAQATSGRMGMITVSIKDVVKNFDSFTEKIIRDLYAWNMRSEFNPRPDIKGDYNVKARGVSSLVMKEIRMQALNQLATTMTEEDWDYVDRREFLAERFKTHDVVLRLKTEEEVQKIREERQNSLMSQLAIAMQQSEIGKNKAQTMSLLAKAKEHNIMALKESASVPEGEDPRITDAELAKKQAEVAGETQKLGQEDQTHQLEMSKSSDMHEMEMAKKTHEMRMADEKHKTEMEMKKKTTEHGMKLKEVETKQKSKKKVTKKIK